MKNTESARQTRPSLLIRIRDAHDADAWRAFVAAYAPLIYGYCRRRGLQEADAADMAQDVLVQVAHSIRAFDYRPEVGRFRDWLGTLTRRRLGRFLTRQRVRTSAGSGTDLLDGDGPLDTAAARGSEAEWNDTFHEHVFRMACDRARPAFEAQTWEAFRQTWIEDRPAPEVAQALGLSVAVVYVAKSRVLKRLREEVAILAEDLPQLAPPRSAGRPD